MATPLFKMLAYIQAHELPLFRTDKTNPLIAFFDERGFWLSDTAEAAYKQIQSQPHLYVAHRRFSTPAQRLADFWWLASHHLVSWRGARRWQARCTEQGWTKEPRPCIEPYLHSELRQSAPLTNETNDCVSETSSRALSETQRTTTTRCCS